MSPSHSADIQHGFLYHLQLRHDVAFRTPGLVKIGWWETGQNFILFGIQKMFLLDISRPLPEHGEVMLDEVKFRHEA
ncbi:hypothetical protein O6P43_023147 [Quillaja saponaria]|uniref:Uncharacterized protein n=1 Tax=Quillaja saponaria TaxID=32244 RepID=A0AAD7PIE9_QUISA|nr:hypothetical protein O6P43_023147 [Quillaja saponaria]